MSVRKQASETCTYLTSGGKGGDDDGAIWRDPYPFAEDCYLVARDQGLYVMDDQGDWELIHEDESMLHEPRPLRARPREPVIPSMVDLSKRTDSVYLSQAHLGRNMAGVAVGQAKKLLVLEVLPKPISGGVKGPQVAGSNLKRVIGEVPVAADGSAYFEAPAMRALMFVLLDEQDRAIQRMKSFITVQPGEVVGCVGCHEQRSMSAEYGIGSLASRKPAPISEPAFMPRYGMIDYQRDIQPIWDKHCVSCHDHNRNTSNICLSGGVTPEAAIGYRDLRRRSSMGSNLGGDPPYSTGTGASALWRLLEEGHHKVRLSEAERCAIRLWLDTGTPYTASYAHMPLDGLSAYGASDNERDRKRGYQALLDAELLSRRCDSCHDFKRGVRRYLDDDYIDLSHPERSLLLLAPLAKTAGGIGRCQAQAAEAGGEVFATTTDPDYLALRGEIRRIAGLLRAGGDHWRPGFKPNHIYLREMRRYGVLDPHYDGEGLDPFALDERYYQQIYHQTWRLAE